MSSVAPCVMIVCKRNLTLNGEEEAGRLGWMDGWYLKWWDKVSLELLQPRSVDHFNAPPF